MSGFFSDLRQYIFPHHKKEVRVRALAAVHSAHHHCDNGRVNPKETLHVLNGRFFFTSPAGDFNSYLNSKFSEPLIYALRHNLDKEVIALLPMVNLEPLADFLAGTTSLNPSPDQDTLDKLCAMIDHVSAQKILAKYPGFAFPVTRAKVNKQQLSAALQSSGSDDVSLPSPPTRPKLRL